MRPWLDTFRKKLVVRGRQGMKVTVVVAVHRGTVWVLSLIHISEPTRPY